MTGLEPERDTMGRIVVSVAEHGFREAVPVTRWWFAWACAVVGLLMGFAMAWAWWCFN